jgi:hypothetical protein
MKSIIQVAISREDDVYTASGVNAPIVIEGNTLEELQENIRDVVALYFDGDDPASLGFESAPAILTNFEVARCTRGVVRVFSGADVVDIFFGFGISVIDRTKYIKLRRSGVNGNETLIVPDHSPIAKGTLRMIFSQASHNISQEELRPHFYND